MAERIEHIPLDVKHYTDKEDIYNIYKDIESRINDDFVLVRHDEKELVLTDYKLKCMWFLFLDKNGNIEKITRW
jgi:hypothetical protein